MTDFAPTHMWHPDGWPFGDDVPVEVVSREDERTVVRTRYGAAVSFHADELTPIDKETD